MRDRHIMVVGVIVEKDCIYTTTYFDFSIKCIMQVLNFHV